MGPGDVRGKAEKEDEGEEEESSTEEFLQSTRLDPVICDISMGAEASCKGDLP